MTNRRQFFAAILGAPLAAKLLPAALNSQAKTNEALAKLDSMMDSWNAQPINLFPRPRIGDTITIRTPQRYIAYQVPALPTGSTLETGTPRP